MYLDFAYFEFKYQSLIDYWSDKGTLKHFFLSWIVTMIVFNPSTPARWYEIKLLTVVGHTKTGCGRINK